ncbi:MULTISPECIES: CDP-diacylglycerol--glycerol-3-phosphate 3-phosphatidyltransferase [Ruminococcus]|uniref:CDP-diacylglycerol--glycerol-3-phosphate 3-phosphatidyltransferase n=1 Tax=Ruminococcus champanellensis (strain DSM 18848 / JCM 17042 / KCTC 15320 / 18P13) TaxID=213810 RepID=D4LAG5_RUMC1|nr:MULTISPECIES: CDP-diacylglycerol--glycerol-3-phosphate 3-phosphatidyltransferase [Ruminococcus]CBL16610.1 CDP-diacylglycerol--glycerol-3-phosphate 3-phosphatidyltransferase [Ruminococcus champanellensis 18P13 = JCM 17042]CDD52780.1 cDP-diacylglycerol--glycerol-3-phosphate 3-phosphatidyltransferase [Ruminococcus sp. CAG:379]
MNLPNKLTLMRVLLIPVFLVFFLIPGIPCHYLLAMIVFIAASITDALDGHLARKHNLVTNFGKFLDPLADKVLVMTALACFVDNQMIGVIPFLIIMMREFMVSGLRLVAANSGTVIAAGFWGKLKTAFTMVTIIAILVYLSFSGDFNSFSLACADTIDRVCGWILTGLVWISAGLTVISGWIYLRGYWKFIDPEA